MLRKMDREPIMTRHRQHPRAARYLICSALAAALVTGCAATGKFSHSTPKAPQVAPLSDSAADRSVASAEQAVLADPQNAATRAALAQAYLAAGRFASAATTFNDAMQLGDNGPRTALSMALAEIGAGNNPMAVRILDKWRDSIPAGDLGLALALAGETGRGVAILGDALRAGENTPKLRQNLAYAYALDGRWREARVMASQDVPPDQIDDRISQWAMQGRPEDFGKRVASLLGTPLRSDPGQPGMLALNRVAPATAPVPQYAASDGELPALVQADQAPDDAGTEFAVREMQPAVAPEEPWAPAPLAPASAPPTASSFAAAFENRPARVSETEAVPAAPRRKVEPRVAGDYAPRPAAARPAHQPLARVAAAASTHLVQLGSFSSEGNAQRAKKIFRSRHPELQDHELSITPAVVNGKKFWRVAAAGFDRGAARGMCSTVKVRGGGCIAYSVQRPLPGGLQVGSNAGSMMARR